jgi:hypothetical protein
MRFKNRVSNDPRPILPLGSTAQGPSSETEVSDTVSSGFGVLIRIIDPSAGSPTETLLRLLLPLSNKVNLTFQFLSELPHQDSVRNIHRIAQSVGATGGVYKGQGRNHDELMIHHY